MVTATKKALGELTDQTAQMRCEVIDEISGLIRRVISEITEVISAKYVVLDKQTNKPVELAVGDLGSMIDDGQWKHWQHKMTEILRFNDDFTLDRMQRIVELQHASDKHAPTDQPTPRPRSTPVRPVGVVVGRTQCIRGLYALDRTLDAQQVALRSAIDYLSALPDVVDQKTAAREVQAIGRMKNALHTQWYGEASRAHHIFCWLMWAHGSGLYDPAACTIEEQLMEMDLSL